MSSTFECPVIKIHLLPHPNADTLSIVKIGGYQVVVKTSEWREGQLAAYIPPDSVVPDRPEWAFLGPEPRHRRIRTRKFRGEWSHGLLFPAPGDLREGGNADGVLGIIPYEPSSSGREGLSARQRRALPWYRRLWSYWREVRERPKGRYPYYDIENYRRLPELFVRGESILITEKVHGANALYTSKRPWYSRNIKIYMRSRTMWKHPFKRDWWQDAYRNTPGLGSLLRDFPGISVYGEVYGRGVQELEYGVTEPHFIAFDIFWQDLGWARQDRAFELFDEYNIPRVSILYQGPYIDMEHIIKVQRTFNNSMLAKHNGNVNQISEGVVIQSLETRKILKLVSDEYLEKVK